ncbi:uncharacterized protein LOC128236901 isoform X2 [Mya arenaria]|nr:uncharacterized protein LOC128236901 isoform X2 [Mya arenaria]XP_052807994.1 uncharacterized protein LOC128236901 isoform X2 [Mya arenaria]
MEIPGKILQSTVSAIDEKCCKPCYEDREFIQAEAYCTSCKKGLCATCVIAHRKQMRSHRIFDKIYDEESYEPCERHPKEVIKYYCPEHDSPICGHCSVLEHGSCKVEIISEMCKSDYESINDDNADLLTNSDGSAYKIENNIDLLTEKDTTEELLASEIELGTMNEKHVVPGKEQLFGNDIEVPGKKLQSTESAIDENADLLTNSDGSASKIESNMYLLTEKDTTEELLASEIDLSTMKEKHVVSSNEMEVPGKMLQSTESAIDENADLLTNSDGSASKIENSIGLLTEKDTTEELLASEIDLGTIKEKHVVPRKKQLFGNEMEIPGKMLQSTESAIDEKCCKPCYEDRESIQADAYCTSCKKELCATCVIAHRKQMRSHRIFAKIYDEESYEPCERHPKEFIKYYCPKHDSPICGHCLVLEHGSCKVEIISEMCKSDYESINDDNADLLTNSDGSAYKIENNIDLLTEKDTTEELLASEINLGTMKEKHVVPGKEQLFGNDIEVPGKKLQLTESAIDENADLLTNSDGSASKIKSNMYLLTEKDTTEELLASEIDLSTMKEKHVVSRKKQLFGNEMEVPGKMLQSTESAIDENADLLTNSDGSASKIENSIDLLTEKDTIEELLASEIDLSTIKEKHVVPRKKQLFGNEMEIPGKMLQSTESAIDEKCCKPCYEDGESVQAEAYCTSCKKGLCATCVIAHRKQMRSHRIFAKIYDEENYEPCERHPKEFIKYYCPKHDSRICGHCSVLEHGSCKVEIISEMCKSDYESINDDNADLLTNSYGSASKIENKIDLLTEKDTSEELLASEINLGTMKEKHEVPGKEQLFDKDMEVPGKNLQSTESAIDENADLLTNSDGSTSKIESNMYLLTEKDTTEELLASEIDLSTMKERHVVPRKKQLFGMLTIYFET